ncbi:energy transducer TonB [Sphingomonas japonica]|uniref:TonB family protein n=1 Tax=Sphingomonas japonica TaxID=511662 RepID=A0ABX0U1K6_9SPHN|nr:energy transducer TonB [Sphingomonas japonica]NIJ24358.1 TonB family protein [Sphingomonas japonica]
MTIAEALWIAGLSACAFSATAVHASSAFAPVTLQQASGASTSPAGSPDCKSGRLFGSESEGIFVLVHGSDENAVIELTRLPARGDDADLRLWIEPNDREIAKSPTPAMFQRGEAKALAFAADADDLAAIDGADAIALRRGSEMVARLPGPAIAEELAKVEACYRSKLVTWGVDVEARSRLSRIAATIPGKHGFTYENYPAEAIRQRLSGTVVLRLVIDETGRVSNCEIAESSGSPILDRAPCPAVRRAARFTPALDANGKPTVSQAIRKITYNILS